MSLSAVFSFVVLVTRHSLIKRVQPGRLQRNCIGVSYILCFSLFLVSVVSFFLKISPTSYFCIEYRFAHKFECQKQVNIWINLANESCCNIYTSYFLCVWFAQCKYWHRYIMSGAGDLSVRPCNTTKIKIMKLSKR